MSAAEPLIMLEPRDATVHEIIGDGLPATGRSAPLWDGTALGIAPRRCLLLDGTPPAGLTLCIDQSDGHALIDVLGTATDALLARFCRIDLHPASFPSGAVARTLFGQVPAVIHRPAVGRITLLLPATYATSLTDALRRAAQHLSRTTA